ncbi:unnamed protein product [Tilletia controversa]|uniref:Trafficking protein particle complex subunit 13 N-terminal domain-containing protein n=3 Tax=Tilletia TaxID=13289 RepID=A0A8X7SZV6_9BASI|nr:hypothetical protein CF336_g1153 [Tilletia laevis]KAE8204154.1 hypothetical protein CF328_g1242 [Tilletia controversa]KAE8264391.1 hypothetical protein A4X03_0g973 [Tilletia caries]KAE8207959.1 hypothetical protein CF335_g767 [Tilletia laevis]KAE8253089.1 hypothetical protein A4X06_0g1707 [Tilletia controversa]
MSASALQRAASVIGAVGGGSGGSGSGRSTPTPTRSASLRSVQNASAGSGTAAAAAAQAGPHSLSLKVMRISAPSLVRAQDRAYFEVPDESFPSSSVSAPEAGAEVGADKADVGKIHAKARAQASALAQDISLAEAGEMQRLYASLAQASSEDGSPGASSQSDIGAAERALRSAAAADMLSNQSALEAASCDPIMRDWPTSTALVLPSSFGTIHLGEAFQAYICLNNESSEPVKDVSLLVEIQQAEKEEELALADKGTLPSSSANPSVVLARLSTTPSPLPLTGQDPDADNDASIQEEYARSLLQPQSKLETTVRHDMRKPGGYVLGCTISYQAWLPAPRMAAGGFDANQNAAPGQWVERSFRKSYRFAVPTCPLTIRSKAHVFTPSSVPDAPLPNAHLTPASGSEADMREAILLEVQIRNDSPRALVLEQASLETDLLALGLLQNPEAAAAAGLGPPFAGWDWESLDRPWLKYSALKSDGRTDATTHDLSTMSRRHFGFSPNANERSETGDDDTGLWEDEDQWLLSSDARQFIFRLTPARQLSTTSSSDDTSSPSESGTSTKVIRLQDLVPPTPPFAAPTTPSSTSAATFNRPMSSASTITSPPPFGGKSLPATPTTRFSMPASGILHGAIPPVMTPLGKLDIAWRMAGPGGEPGRLQTSMLFWRRDLREPPGGGLPQSPAGAGPNVYVARR